MFVKPNDLDSVRRADNYFVGELRGEHPVLSYLENGVLTGVFGSVKAVWSAISDLKWKPQRGESSDDRGRNDFHTFESLDEALTVFRSNPRSIRNFTEDSLALTSEESIGRDVTFDVTGDYIDVGRFLEGQPECFGVAYNGNPSNVRVNMILNVSAVSYVSAAALQRKQERVLRLIDWLENQGVRCRLIGYESTHTAHMEIMVKDFHESLDLNDVAVVTHGDFLRRVAFLVSEQSKTWSSGYGSPNDFTRKMKKFFTPDPSDGMTVFIEDQSTSDLEHIDAQFDKLRDKMSEVIEHNVHDFSTVYSVEL